MYAFVLLTAEHPIRKPGRVAPPLYQRFGLRFEMPSPATPSTSASSTPERRLALRIATLPRDTNHYGTIFGGVILSYIDQAGFVEARRHGVHRWVTVAIDRVEFKAPVHVGDVVNFYAQTTRFGTSSVTVRIEVEAERNTGGLCVPVTSAGITLVAVDASGKPIPFASAPSV